MPAGGLDVAVVGEITLDEIVHEGQQGIVRQLGGGAVYGAIGAWMWNAVPHVVAVIGTNAPRDDLDVLASTGIDFENTAVIDRPCLGMWLLHERSGARQQVPKVDAPTMAELDSVRPSWGPTLRPDGVHVAPQTTEGQRSAVEIARSQDVPFTVDCMVEPYIDIRAYIDGSILNGAAGFLPSEHEIHGIWGDIDTVELARQLRDHDVKSVLVTRGGHGAELITSDSVVQIPAIPVPVIDATGAGDAMAGGFLVGLLETGDPRTAAMYGTVAASFVVETRSPLDAVALFTPQERRRRLQAVQARVIERRLNHA